MLEKVQFQQKHLCKSERKVADVILAAPGRSIHLSIAMLAQEANVSELTVNRFCRSMNIRVFPDFKLHIAQSLPNGTPYVNRNVEIYCQPHSRFTDQGKKIAFFGLGFSAAITHDAMNKFFRFNVPVIYSDDIVVQRMSCMNCRDDDVIVLISHTWQNQESSGTGAVGAGKRCNGDRPNFRNNAAGTRSHAGHYP